MSRHSLPSILSALALTGACFAQDKPAVTRTGVLAAPEATQAAAAHGDFIYAIANAVIAKYDRATGQRIAVSTGAAKHLNSGFFRDGKLYCAHSNYPAKPEKSEIMMLDPESMVLSVFKGFGESNGSLTWAVHDGTHWWCNFAYYGADNAKTRLVQFDGGWHELRAWTYPQQVIGDLGTYSISGGIWMDGQLLVTGHDHRVIYRLRLPPKGDILELVDVLPGPFPGQGIASDTKPGGIVGIDRGRKQVIFGKLQN
jgi:hypothetical protein